MHHFRWQSEAQWIILLILFIRLCLYCNKLIKNLWFFSQCFLLKKNLMINVHKKRSDEIRNPFSCSKKNLKKVQNHRTFVVFPFWLRPFDEPLWTFPVFSWVPYGSIGGNIFSFTLHEFRHHRELQALEREIFTLLKFDDLILKKKSLDHVHVDSNCIYQDSDHWLETSMQISFILYV